MALDKTKIQRLLNLKQNAPLELFKVAQKLEEDMERKTQELIEKQVKQFKAELREEIEAVKSQKEEIINEVAKKTDKLPITELLKGIPKIKGDIGDKGDKGDIGNIGDKGDKGDIGERGLTGKSGKEGERGKGSQGEQGLPGKDALPEKPEELAKKLNTLKGKVEPKVIKGLGKMFDDIKTAIRRVNQNKTGAVGGGGMGNLIHETHNISAGTTTITTTYPIAQEGRAIMRFFYESANLEMTNHVTVGSGRQIITFNVDVQAQLEDNTTAYIAYIRG